MKKIRGIALDIDETLSWTVKQWFEEMRIKFTNPENLTAIELVTKYKYAQNVPYWQTKEISEWKIAAIESNELQEKLPLIENSNHLVQKINEIIPIVAYITVRPESVIEGTKKWLQQHKFPDAKIILRPPAIPHEDGNKWKANILQTLYPEVLGIIDDNPRLISFLPSDYKGTIFLYDADDYKEKTTISVIPCKTWDKVYESIKKYFI